MAQDRPDDHFDIACLRGIATDPSARRLALAAALIKLHALSIARTAPEMREEALRIVAYSRQLFRTLPTRESIEDIIDRFVAPTTSSRAGRRSREQLVEALWEHLQIGKD